MRLCHRVRCEKSGLTGLVGTDGFFLRDFGDPATAFPVMGIFNPSVESKFLFQFAFCAVSLAIVWGTTLERIKFGVYIIYAIVFSTIIYPLGAHWVFGGGFLQTGDWLGTGIVGMQDFAGSTAVHLIVQPAVSPRCSSSDRGVASTRLTARPARSRVTTCRSSVSA